MNARKKAKMYKKRCQQLEQMLTSTQRTPIVIDRRSIVTLRTEQLVETSELYALSATEECGFSALNKMMASQFLHQILNYANIETINNPYGYYGKTLIQATIKIVD